VSFLALVTDKVLTYIQKKCIIYIIVWHARRQQTGPKKNQFGATPRRCVLEKNRDRLLLVLIAVSLIALLFSWRDLNAQRFKKLRAELAVSGKIEKKMEKLDNKMLSTNQDEMKNIRELGEALRDPVLDAEAEHLLSNRPKGSSYQSLRTREVVIHGKKVAIAVISSKTDRSNYIAYSHAEGEKNCYTAMKMSGIRATWGKPCEELFKSAVKDDIFDDGGLFYDAIKFIERDFSGEAPPSSESQTGPGMSNNDYDITAGPGEPMISSHN